MTHQLLRRAGRRARAVLLAFGVACGAIAPQAAPASAQAARSPIEHVVVLVQEGHSFDNYFGSYPGAEGLPPDTCVPVAPADDDEECIHPFRLGSQPVEHLDQSNATFRAQYNRGGMDGFVYAHRQRGRNGALAMGYYDAQDLPFYWNMADEYVLFDHFFGAPSGLAGRLRAIAGATAAERGQISAAGLGDMPTLFDELEQRGISWKYYVQNYDPRLTYRTMGSDERAAAQVARVPLLALDRFVDDPARFAKIADLDQYYEDARNGTLPAVAYIAASSAGERAPTVVQAGPQLVRRLVNMLMQSDAWERSAFLLTYDGWGGWYDHVAPPPAQGGVSYGFRVPALMVSPYARRGHVDSTLLEHASIVRFIQETFGLPISGGAAHANSLQSAFDWSQQPRAPQLIPDERGVVAAPEPRRYIIYICYSAIMFIAAAAMAWAIASARGYALAASAAQPPQEGTP